MSGTTPEQRGTGDRRQFSWKTVCYGFLRSRRHRVRREDDTEVLFLDWHHPWLFFLSVGIMTLSGVDAFMTLQLLERGMFEANPIMATVMGHGTTAFAVSKMLMTGISILILVFLAKARILNRMRAHLVLTAFFVGYACLVCYEFVHLMRAL